MFSLFLVLASLIFLLMLSLSVSLLYPSSNPIVSSTKTPTHPHPTFRLNW